MNKESAIGDLMINFNIISSEWKACGLRSFPWLLISPLHVLIWPFKLAWKWPKLTDNDKLTSDNRTQVTRGKKKRKKKKAGKVKERESMIINEEPGSIKAFF